MKKNVGKKFRLMALLTSLTLLLWGGVIACSNGSDDDDPTSIDEDKATELVEDLEYTADGNLIEVCAASELKDLSIASITVSVADVKGEGDDWWVSYDNGGKDWVSMKNGWDDSIKGYKTTITDSSTISYFKENGIKIGMRSGLTAKVTVTVTKSESTDNAGNTGTNTDSTGTNTDNTGTNTDTTGTNTDTTGTNTDNTGTNTDNTGTNTDNTGTNTDNTGTNTDNTGTNTDNTGTNTDNTGTKKDAVKLKGAFFESDDEKAEWIYCNDELTEIESGIWEGEITAVRGWDHFGVEVTKNDTTTWYGAEDGLEDDVTDAKLVEKGKDFWLATAKGGKSKVTVNLNTMTITVAKVSTTNPSNGVKLIEDFLLSEIKKELPGVLVAEASKFQELPESATVTVTITCNTWDTIDDGKSWFSCNFNGENTNDWNSLIKIEDWDEQKVSATITGDNITALKDGGLYIVGNNKTATITVTYE